MFIDSPVVASGGIVVYSAAAVGAGCVVSSGVVVGGGMVVGGAVAKHTYTIHTHIVIYNIINVIRCSGLYTHFLIDSHNFILDSLTCLG